MDIADMKVGEVYSFTMQSPIIYGSRVEKAQLVAVASFDMATTVAPIEQQYAQIYSALPAGTPYDPKNCVYYVFKQLNGSTIAIADQWIVEGSVEKIERVKYRVMIYDGTLGDVPKIQAALTAIGKTEISIEAV